jgi:hypothetical protein
MSVPKRGRLFATVLAGVVMSSGVAAWSGQPEPKKPETPATPKPADKHPAEAEAALPKGEDVLDRFVKETGGKEAYDNIKSLVLTGELGLGMGMTGKMKMYVQRPGKLLSQITIPQIGEIKSGSDGETVWSDSPMEGPKILEGPQRELTLDSVHISDEANWRERYTEAKCVGIEDVKGKPAYKVELTSKSGTKRTGFYDKESGLLVKQTMVIKLEQGEIPTESYISDYKKVGDLLFPHKTTTTMMTQEMKTTFDTIEVNPDLPASTFELPADIKELKEAKEKKAKEPKPEPKPVDPAPSTTPKPPQKK